MLLSAAALALVTCGGGGSAEADAQTQSQLAEPQQVTAEALRSAVSDERVQRFYEARNWSPAWTGERAGALLEALGRAERHGLDRSMFLDGDVQGAPADPARREAALTRAALAYADALADGYADPEQIRDVFTLARPSVDVVAGLNQAIEGGNVREWLEGLAPSDAAYRALSEAYVRYRQEAARGQGPNIGSGELIREGDQDPRVPQIIEALRANGYLSGSGPGGTTYTAEVAAAVERMQQDFGIAADGIVGPDTLEVLNTGAAERARQLAVNLERRRWLEREPPATRIDVNTAAAHLVYWRDGERTDRRKVIVGQPDWETPQLGSPIFRLVANPTWTVPKSIEREEIAPRGESYLRRNNMVRRDGWIVQLPGPENALGEVKFDMRNDQSIYLHDTPAKHLFERNQRHFSHGCVRVEDALGFARMLAEHDGKLAEFERALASGEETFIDLDRNIPVRLVYHSVFVEEGGTIVFRTDAYGWDEDVAEALGLDRRQRRTVQTHVSDVGP
ncbi:MAG: L,D-transpeptidase family protein [Pseudomonadota bacterium]|nr:L,D-transpeptidase family protein [Pseudomonadota bacterium]